MVNYITRIFGWARGSQRGLRAGLEVYCIANGTPIITTAVDGYKWRIRTDTQVTNARSTVGIECNGPITTRRAIKVIIRGFPPTSCLRKYLIWINWANGKTYHGLGLPWSWISNRANGKTFITAFVGAPADITRTEVHIPSGRQGVPLGRPIVAVRIYIVVRRAEPKTSCRNILKFNL